MLDRIRALFAAQRSPLWIIVVATLLSLAWYLWRTAAAAYQPADAVLVQGATSGRLALTALGLALLFGALRVFDALGGTRFTQVLRQLEMVPMAQAVYYAARFVGIALLIGLLLG